MSSVLASAAPPLSTRLPIRRRLALLALLSAAGGALFLPFAAGPGMSAAAQAGFVLAVTVVGTLAAWAGLRCADAVALPMPYLRALDGETAGRAPRSALAGTLGLGVGLGTVGLAAVRLLHAPSPPVGVAARALSAVFAAGPLEIVLHLFLMSAVVRLARGRRAPGIIAAALALVLFHLAGGDTPPALVAASMVLNGAIGIALGWIYAAYGFEFVVLGHAVAHLITVVGG